MVPLLTRCAKCGVAISPGQDCIQYPYGLCCLGRNCGPGPAFADPGTWDGEKFIDAFTTGAAGEIRIRRPRSIKLRRRRLEASDLRKN
ncbi:MAG: hypothetical protein ACOZBH_02175 [Patescibacteria group bacterium]